MERSDDELTYGVWAPPSRSEHFQSDNKLTDLKKHGGIVVSFKSDIIAERKYIKEYNRQLARAAGYDDADPNGESRES